MQKIKTAPRFLGAVFLKKFFSFRQCRSRDPLRDGHDPIQREKFSRFKILADEAVIQQSSFDK